jgi:hypothetical protein
MSRHHMLPPIIYTPPPQPKKVEPKKRRLAIGMFDEMDESAETSETAAATPAQLAIKPPLAPMGEIEKLRFQAAVAGWAAQPGHVDRAAAGTGAELIKPSKDRVHLTKKSRASGMSRRISALWQAFAASNRRRA